MSNGFKETQEILVPYLAVQRYAHLIVIAVGEVRQWFALTDGLFEHPVRALTRAFRQPAPCERFRQSAVAGRLSPQQVFHRNAGRQSAGADNFETFRELTDENRSAQSVVPMRDGVEDRFASHGLVDSRDLEAKQTIGVLKHLVAQIDGLPELVEIQEKSPA